MLASISQILKGKMGAYILREKSCTCPILDVNSESMFQNDTVQMEIFSFTQGVLS